MQKIAIGVLVILISAHLSVAASGVVVFTKIGCDYFIVETSSGFAVLEWYGGNIPEAGDELVGDFESFGFHDIYNLNEEEELTVWVEDFWLSRRTAFETLFENCD